MTTCGGCAARWTPAGAAHCAACHRTFGGVTGFDRHRTADGACRSPASLGLDERDGIWRAPPPDVTVRPAYWTGGP